ncbi:MAG: hypothetical protein DMF40_06325 [Verrucomicrobia bacterium]|nr:MAG: hypothetical protein DMF40_06325 [Verrucomicrobiota bacterium]
MAGTIHKCEVFVFAPRSTSSASNTTHFPSRDGIGAPTRFNFIMSSNVNGRLPLLLTDGLGEGVCANVEKAIASEATKIFQCMRREVRTA